MKKIALLNIANNITDYKTVASGETLYIKRIIEDKTKNRVDVISKKHSDNVLSFDEVEDINDYDILMVIGAAINFFGGKENPIIINNYKLMSQWKGQYINILQTDMRLPFKQLWPSIKNRGWGYTKDEVWVNSKINIISQSSDLEDVSKQYNNDDFTDLSFSYFPIDKYICYFLKGIDNKEKEFDLIYGGSFRGGNRAKKFEQYLMGDIADKFNVHVFGSISEKQLQKINGDITLPSIGKKVPMDKMRDELNRSLVNIIVGEKKYNNNMTTVRLWESSFTNSVVLIEEEFDKNHEIFKYSEENEIRLWGNTDNIRYFKNKQELIHNIEAIKSDIYLQGILLAQQKFLVIRETMKDDTPKKELKRRGLVRYGEGLMKLVK